MAAEPSGSGFPTATGRGTDGNAGSSGVEIPATADRYTNNSQLVLVAVVEALALRMLEPQRLKDLAEALTPTYSRDQVFRTLQTLQTVGWAETVGDGWILSPALTRLADRLRLALITLNRRYLENELA